MKTSRNGRALIESYEGLITKAYDDANDHVAQPGQPVRGVLTIGYGHTTAAGKPTVYAGQAITKDQADQILGADLGKVEQQVSNLVKVPLNQNQFDALVSFQFNTGALGRSSALKALNEKDYEGAANKLTLYNQARQIGPGPIAGLVRRRADEKALFLKPVSAAAQNTTATAIIVGGAAATASAPQNYWPYIIAGTLVVAAIAYVVVKVYKHNTEVHVELPTDQGLNNVVVR